MADQMQCMGFDFSKPGSLEAFFDRHWADKTITDMTEGVYLQLHAGDHLTCILSVDRDSGEVLDWDMHYVGNTRCGCAFSEDLALDEAGQSGFISVSLKPGEEELPAALSAPMLSEWPDREAGSPGVLQLSAYANTICLCDADIPETWVADLTECTVSFICRVQNAQRLTNPDTDVDFWHMEVSCLGISLDLLAASPDLDMLPAEGQLLSVHAVLTARTESGVSE